MVPILRIATRKSPLALWQAQHVQFLLNKHHPQLHIELVEFSTKGDEILDKSLSKIGGKGLFIKRLEQALLDNEADMAVHSMKDVPAQLSGAFTFGAVLERGNPYDALVSNRYTALDQLPAGAKIGTSSLRRACQIRHQFPHIQCLDLRGSVGTRLQRLDDGKYDAIILAAAGLERLGMHARIQCLLNAEDMLPAVAQGVIGIEIRNNDPKTQQWLKGLNHQATAITVQCERACNKTLNGSCDTPIGIFSQQSDDQLCLRALVGAPDGSHIIRHEACDPITKASELGEQVAQALIKKGAQQYLK